MKVTISITAENGDTLVESREIDSKLLQFTPIYSATLIWEVMHKSVIEMVRVFQKVEDDALVAPIVDQYQLGRSAGQRDRLSGSDSSLGGEDCEVYKRGYLAGYKNA